MVVGIIIIAFVILLLSIKQVNEYERGIKFTLGKYSKMMNPGWNFVFPIFQSFKKVDIRTKAVDVPEQDAITKDNEIWSRGYNIYGQLGDNTRTDKSVMHKFQILLFLYL